MTKTSSIVILTLGDAELASSASSDTHSRADITDLVTGAADRSLNYATYEPDKWLLDGSFHFAPDPAHIGFVSDEISLVDKSFTSDPVLTLTLDAVVDIEQGITLEFSDISGDYATAVNIEYQDAGATPIDDDDYIPTGYNFFAAAPTLPVADVKYIVITFSETSEAYRHIRLLGVYVDEILFDKSDIKKATLVQDVDFSISTLPVNTTDLEIYSTNGYFDPLDPDSLINSLTGKVKVYSQVDLTRTLRAANFISTKKAIDKYNITLSLVNRIEKVEEFQYDGEIFNKDTIFGPPGDGVIKAEDLLPLILTPAGIEYSLDSALEQTYMRGWLPKTNGREALNQICFALRAYAHDADDEVLNISPIPEIASLGVGDVDFSLTTAHIFLGSKITLLPVVTSVSVVGHNYIFEGIETAKLLYSETLENGTYTIRFNEPVTSVIYTGTTASYSIDDQQANYIVCTITSPGQFIVTRVASFSDGKSELETIIPSFVGLPTSVKRIADARLVNSVNIDNVGTSLAKEYSQSYLFEGQIIYDEIIPIGSIVSIDNNYDNVFIGRVYKKEINLLAGIKEAFYILGHFSGQEDDNEFDVMTTGIYNDNSLKIVYTGTWLTALTVSSTGDQAYENDLHYVETGATGSATFYFRGTDFAILYSQLPDRGFIEVWVDDILKDTVDQSGAETWRTRYESDVFSDTLHKVEIVHVETGGGDVTDLDAIEIY